ncbi:MAG: YbaB/EbfC family DNA-binding protein [Actinophytocola sp.]|uniref:YbaB/EbfC family nucleoid-associated protein n=1 Tax=Actinophytocola sp. TaxID=1872138 RepID=UPI001321350F|nr:YbaB/EbfC family nucleoid-associated protein [Actinophytocola sp.]MPZ86247.1 YbaB/EbfC family DNA-binding protein [Actinophytocola sp.]
MISSDPTKAAEELDKWAAGLEQRAQRYNELQQRLDETSATDSTQDGAIRVTVDSNGVLTQLELSERIRDLAPSQLSSEVMACMRRAQAKLRARVEDLIETTVPADDEPARNLVAQYQQRFPDLPDDSAGHEVDHGERLGAVEDEPAPPPSARPTRRSTADHDDDWDDESPLR